MDAGTTVVEMSRHLHAISPLTVVTNALNVALAVGGTTEAQIVLLGGNFSRKASSTVGPLTEQTFAELSVQKAFLGSQALDLENGLTDTTVEIAEVKRAMTRAAREVVLLCDSSKSGSTGFIKVAPLNAAHTIISDEGFPAESRAVVEALGIKVLLA